MKPDQLATLRAEIDCGHKFLRACTYDAKAKRLELRLGSNVCEGSTKTLILQAATEPSELGKWVGHQIYGVCFYHHLHSTQVCLDFGQTVTFEVNDEPKIEPNREEAGRD